MSRFVTPEAWTPAGGITLEKSARDVVESTASRSVIAGPGAGKTELLAQRACFLLETGECAPPRRILAISFKRDAAKNLKTRVARRCSPEQVQRFDSYTYDAFAKNLVDRFLALAPAWCRPPLGYHVLFPKPDDWTDFRRGASPPSSLGGRAALESLKTDDIERWGPLPLEDEEPTNMRAWAGREWWRHCLSGARPGLTFGMILQLADAILAHNSDVLNALRVTYSHLFLDEFQDTTGPQYGLVRRAFGGSSAILTAVGDTKQRIMTWAGAEAKAFDWFDKRFSAKRERLQLNHRSNKRIVQIINDLVTEIEPDAVETLCGRANDEVPKDAAAFYVFDTGQAEAEWIASFVAGDIAANAESGRRPDDFALLVRSRPDKTEAQLASAFAKRGLSLRNEAQLIENIPLQDLVGDEIVVLVLGLLRIALGVRSAEAYGGVQETLAVVLGVDYEKPRDVKRAHDLVRSVVNHIRRIAATGPMTANMVELVGMVVETIGETRLRRAFRQYDDPRYFSSVLKALAALMSEHAKGAADWEPLIDGVEGIGQVRLMTIHKSKGLEYHTVIFVGLHQRAFWGYKGNEAEETNNFFVALSRARERVYFTRAKPSGDTSEISGLVDLLAKAKVPIIEVPN